jgi:hypothetical protein
LRGKRRLKVFENSVLRRIFGPKREGDGSWRKIHNDELTHMCEDNIKTDLREIRADEAN